MIYNKHWFYYVNLTYSIPVFFISYQAFWHQINYPKNVYLYDINFNAPKHGKIKDFFSIFDRNEASCLDILIQFFSKKGYMIQCNHW